MKIQAYGPFVNQGSTTQYLPDLTSAIENATIVNSAASGTIPFSILSSSVLYYATASSGNFTLNFIAGPNSTLNSMLATSQSASAVFIVNNGATAYALSAVQIDGVAVTPAWVNGTVPTTGNANSLDIYTFTILKTADSTYKVLATGPSRFA
jgi:hypothetical protein